MCLGLQMIILTIVLSTQYSTAEWDVPWLDIFKHDATYAYIVKWENGKTMVVCVDVKFVVRSTNDHPYHRTVYSYSTAEWDVPWLDIFKHDATYAYIVKWENGKTMVVCVDVKFVVRSTNDHPYHRTVYSYSTAEWDVPWLDIFKHDATYAYIVKWENGKTMVVCVDVKFVVRSTNDHPYHRTVYSYSTAEWDVPWLDIFKHDATYAYIVKWENGKTMVVCVDVKFVVRSTNDHPYHRTVYSYSTAEWDVPWLDI